ncbi:hypothetical protein E8E11_002169 [Didymella keratinophila]|nr:hypothetical protein E8E11_002169 [Didymella keratinophila]
MAYGRTEKESGILAPKPHWGPYVPKVIDGMVSGQSTCYFANGTALPKTPDYLEYQACSGSNICCGLNRSNPANGDPADGNTMDECLPNGLCQNRRTEAGIGKVAYWVDFCTNSDVSADGCLDVCQQTKNLFGNTPMVPCDGTATSERWCCGDSNNCCTSNVGVVRLAQVLGGTLSSIVSSSAGSSTTVTSSARLNAATTGSPMPASANASSTPTSTDAASASSLLSSSSSSSSNSDSKLSGGAITGIVIGALAGIALLGAAIFFARRAAMWKKKASAAPEAGEASAYTQHSNGYGRTAGHDPSMNDKYAHAHQGEMYGSAQTHELPGGALESELPTTAPKK